MKLPWLDTAHLESFLQLNFLFSGLEVSSTAVFLARVAALLVFGVGLIWVTFRVVMKVLDCIQALISGFGNLPGSFFLVLLLVVPLSGDSIGARWIGYLVLSLCALGLGALAVLVVVVWKYGVDQAVRLIAHMRTVSGDPDQSSRDSSFPPENEHRPELDPSLMKGNARA